MTSGLPVVMEGYLDALRAANQHGTARGYATFLRKFWQWLGSGHPDLLTVTPQMLVDYQIWLSTSMLARSTQRTCVLVIKSFYAWLFRRGAVILDPAAKLKPPEVHQDLTVRKDHLSLQEATALVQTLAVLVTGSPSGSEARALASRNLALVSMALATGRRASGLVHLKLASLDLDRNELRVDWEKGKTGRVLPVAPWASVTVHGYLAEARSQLLSGRASDWLFVSQRAERLCERGFANVVEQAVATTIKRNPDLTDLPGKNISTHSLRVSFATMLFANGCNIRSLNELMLHSCLSTTARYTPIPIEDLRRVLLGTHPRA